jgi:hypothetical protein
MSRRLARSLVRRVLARDHSTKGLRGLVWRQVARMLDASVARNESGNNSSVR